MNSSPSCYLAGKNASSFSPSYTASRSARTPQLVLSRIEDGSMSATHLWKLEERGTAMLGAAHMDGSFQIAIRYTTEDIKPVIIPAKSANR